MTLLGAVQTIALLSLSAGNPAATSTCTLDRASGTTIAPTPFLANGWGVRWHYATNRIVFDYQSQSGYYRLATIRPDGSARADFPDAGTSVPQKHRGSAYWDPSGRFVVFIAQKSDWSGRKLFGSPDYEALPGFGRHDDLWVATADGKRSWQLTHEPNTPDEGILIPVFSPDGKHIAWSARQPGGTYVLRVADFIESPEPHIGAVRDYEPGGKAYYETGSYSSDGKSIFYTSDQESHAFFKSQIYRLDLATGTSTRLTNGGDYNEHPTVVKTADGDRIVYMSTHGVQRFPFHVLPGTDWYVMKPDGAHPVRLSTMNLRTDNPENFGGPRFAGTVAVAPDGNFMYGDVQDDIATQSGMSLEVHFTCP